MFSDTSCVYIGYYFVHKTFCLVVGFSKWQKKFVFRPVPYILNTRWQRTLLSSLITRRGFFFLSFWQQRKNSVKLTFWTARYVLVLWHSPLIFSLLLFVLTKSFLSVLLVCFHLFLPVIWTANPIISLFWSLSIPLIFLVFFVVPYLVQDSVN